MSAKILGWRPKRPRGGTPTLDARPLWTVHKQQTQIECFLQGRSADGWNIRVLLNGQWFFCCRFTSWDEAIQTAGSKYAELRAGGWLPTRVKNSASPA